MQHQCGRGTSHFFISHWYISLITHFEISCQNWTPIAPNDSAITFHSSATTAIAAIGFRCHYSLHSSNGIGMESVSFCFIFFGGPYPLKLPVLNFSLLSVFEIDLGCPSVVLEHDECTYEPRIINQHQLPSKLPIFPTSDQMKALNWQGNSIKL